MTESRPRIIRRHDSDATTIGDLLRKSAVRLSIASATPPKRAIVSKRRKPNSSSVASNGCRGCKPMPTYSDLAKRPNGRHNGSCGQRKNTTLASYLAKPRRCTSAARFTATYRRLRPSYGNGQRP